MITTITKNIITVLTILQEEQKEAYLVGGCVRDMLMERPIHDYDITTNALPMETMKIFRRHGYTCIPTGIQHGTITVLIEKEHVEITTYRIDQAYQNHRSPDTVEFTYNLIEDLNRRDFTMNAIALSLDGTIIDPFHGQEDIKKGCIRCVGNPKKRFEEDALRILRAIRFACVLNFEIEQQTIEAIKQHVSLLSYISKERIRDEFNKLLMGEKENTLTYLKEMQILPYILDNYTQLYQHEQKTPWHIYDIFTHTDVALNHTLGYPLESKLAIIFHDIGKVQCETFDDKGIAHYKRHALVSERMAVEQLKALKYDNRTIQKVAKLVLYHDYYVQKNRKILRRFLSKFDNDMAFSLQALDVQIADDMAKNLAKSQEKIDIIHAAKEILLEMEKEKDYLSLKDLAINGSDLKDLGFEGKVIGTLLQEAYSYVLDDLKRNTREELLAFCQKGATKLIEDNT